ncbi:hypothetical protein QTI33_04280 [Variovorax sp. J22P271]|uniref:hypothetical protein n=1 Tax=Variovorax davisae TaxID=3053515 RepID=UPI002574B896|nr:hypothetical protein [Variovorax sp. J22P271]MDM0031353.1 hypothetical protein [Variovorax sp. J22P271]
MPTPILQLKPEYKRLLEGGASAMTIANADMAGSSFAGVWENLSFTGCDFAGTKNIQLSAMRNCRFVDCSFLAPDHDFGKMTNVSFTQCQSVGRSIFGGTDGSTGVLFEGCSFSGGAAAPRSFEGIGCTGEVTFRGCTGQGEVLVSGTRLTVENCQFGSMTFVVGRPRKRGALLSATVLFDGCQGTGVWRMADGRMQDSEIRNSRFEEIVYDGMEGGSE